MTIISHQKHVTNVSFAIFIREIFHAYFKCCNIWLNVLIDLTCIEAYNALLYKSAGDKKKKTLKTLIKRQTGSNAFLISA